MIITIFRYNRQISKHTINYFHRDIFIIRFVQWSAFMVRRSKRWRGVRDDREQLELVEFQPGTIYKYYYTLEDSDPGIMMETNLATKEVSINREYI